MTLALLVIAALAAGAAFAFYWQYSALKTSLDGLKASAATNEDAAKKAAKERDAAKEELARKRTESADLREKLAEVRARQAKNQGGEKRQKSRAEVELMEDLELARRTLVEAENRADAVYKDMKAQQDALAQARIEKQKLEEALKNVQAAAARAAAAPAAAAPVAAAPAAAAPSAEGAADPAASIKAELAEVKAKNVSLENQVREARRKATEAEEGAKNARGRVSNVQRMAQVQKSELDLFKEKLVWSEKRVVELERLLFDNKIELPVRESAPSPKAPQLAPALVAREGSNTGGEGVVAESADYVPEQVATPAEAAEPAPEATSGESAGEGSGAVPPLRRPRSEVEAREA